MKSKVNCHLAGMFATETPWKFFSTFNLISTYSNTTLRCRLSCISAQLFTSLWENDYNVRLMTMRLGFECHHWSAIWLSSETNQTCESFGQRKEKYTTGWHNALWVKLCRRNCSLLSSWQPYSYQWSRQIICPKLWSAQHSYNINTCVCNRVWLYTL